MEQVNIGVIGIGNMGSGHAKRIAEGQIKGLLLYAVADINAVRLEWARNTLPDSIKCYESAEELLEDENIDAILIATPHYDHPDIAIKALRKEIHVLSEKPAGVYTKQVRLMNEEAQKHEVIFGMMFNQRTNPLYIKIHEVTHAKKYGEIKRVNWIVTDWYRTQAYYNSGGWRATWDGEGGGVLLNQCPHNLDLLQWICGMPSKIYAFCHEGKWHDIEVEDDVTAYLEFENGATGVFITSTGDAPGTNRLEIDYEMAKLVCENGTLRVYELETNEREFCFTTKEGFAKPEGKWIEIKPEGIATEHNGVLQAFTDAILQGTNLIAKGEEGIKGLMISNAMHLSSWLGKAISLPINEKLFLNELNKKRKTSQKKENIVEAVLDTEGSYGGNHI